MSRHEYTYIARKPCGCCVAWHVDDGSAYLREWLGDWVIRGLTISKHETSTLQQGDYPLGCTHEEKQLEMFTTE